MVQTTASQLHWRMTRVREELFRLNRETGEYRSEYLNEIGQISILDMALEDAVRGRFPAVYSVAKEGRLTASDWPDFVKKATELVARIEAIAEAQVPTESR
jgi:hypothetical protein